MPWRTTNKELLKSSVFWATLPDGFKNTVIEDKADLPKWDCSSISIPVGTRYDKKTNTVIFPTKVKDIQQLYDKTIKDWLYFPSYSNGAKYSGTLSSDGLVLQLNYKNDLINDTDLINGSYRDLLEFDSPTIKNVIYKTYPIEWSLPILTLDPNQINDKTTYDGSFPFTTTEIRAVAEAGRANRIVVWAKTEDLINISAQNVNNDSKELSVLKEKLSKIEILVKSLTETIK